MRSTRHGLQRSLLRNRSTEANGTALLAWSGVLPRRASRLALSPHTSLSIHILLLAMLLPQFAFQAEARAAEPTLWISDNVTDTIYQVTPDGTLVSSFPTLLGAHSGVDVDPFTDTLWGAAEQAGGGRVVNFSKVGEPPSACGVCAPVILGSDFGATEIEGVGVDTADGSLWVVEDLVTPNIGNVYNIEQDGTLLSSFPTSNFDSAAISPQAIAVDPFDDTLWVTDNSSEMIYNVTRTGSLIASIPALVYTSVLDPGITEVNPQGISVDASNGTLWVTDRTTDRIYNIASGRNAAPAGDLISSFESSSYDVLSVNPTGIAYDAPIANVPSLGQWGLMGLAIAMVAVARRLRALNGSHR